MALNVPVFKTRALSALVFVIVMFCGLFINQWSFFLLFLGIHIGCWLEFQQMISLIDEDYKNISRLHKYAVIVLGCGFMMWMTNRFYTIFSISLSDTGRWLMLTAASAILISAVLSGEKRSLKNLAFSSLGLLYISLCWGLMIGISHIMPDSLSTKAYSWSIPLLLIISIWINDTMAYMVGSFIGKTPFSKISPKKTWEGTIGGILLCILTIFITFYIAEGKYVDAKVINYSIIAAIAAIAGTSGDLFESKLKRLAGVKDSGSLLPGHGGFLDRFDSLLFATPLVWLFLKLFG